MIGTSTWFTTFWFLEQSALQIISMNPVKENRTQKRYSGCAIFYLLMGILCVLIGILSVLYDFQELVMNERIKVRPGLPPFKFWQKPSADIDIGIKLNIFAVENPHEFLANSTAKLKLKEIGPITYKKLIRQEDIVFHDEDSTLSFSTAFDIVFDEERNEPGILNQTVTVVNPLLLIIAAVTHDVFFARLVFNLIAKNDHVFINRTIYEILWNNSSPIFDTVKRIPFAAPRQNAGIMFNSFYPKANRYNVNIGLKHGYENFFKINTFNGLSRIDVYNNNFPDHCPFSLKGATEGSGLPPHIGKDDVIYAYSMNLCRTYPMVYNSTVYLDGIKAYKYVYSDKIFARLEDLDLDCLKQTGNILLPDGLSDSSKCAWGLPIALSNPHFWGYHGAWENYLEGLMPNTEKHSSYITVEPTSGIQMKGRARLQSNIALPRLVYYSPNIIRFSEMILPLFWMEFFMNNNDPLVHRLLITFVSLPEIQNIFLIFVSALSCFFIYKSVKLTIINKTMDSCKEQGIIFEQMLLCLEK